jgi:5-methylcytosine-specific restriction endonuclease McrA
LYNGECAYCGSKVNLTLDHFIPLTKGGSDVQGNLLPACLSCNSGKRDRDVIEWYKKQPFFDKKRLKQILKILGKTENNYDQIPLF